MIRIAFSDMDGTFLTPEKTVTPENARMLDAAFERGVQFVPCSGRNVGDLPREVVSHPSVRYAICCNGALIVDTSTQEVLRKVLIEKDLVRSLYERVRNMRVTFDVFADGRVYTHRDRFPIIDEVDLSAPTKAFIKAGRTVHSMTIDELLDHVDGVNRLNLFFHNASEAQAIWDAVDAIPQLRRTHSLPCNVEVTDVEAHKGNGVRWLCGELGISTHDAVAFGDNDNDITMLQAVGDGVAMDNAEPSCKAVADHITASCADSGVARYLMPILES